MSELEKSDPTIADPTPSNSCPNCQTILSTTSIYCNFCGQKQGTKKRSLYQLFKEFLDNFLNLDARIWRTLLNIFVPGKLTKEYFRGRHQSYSHPIRLFLITSIALFSILSFKGLNFLKIDLVESDAWKNAEKSVYFEEFSEVLDSVSNILKIEQPNAVAINVLDSLESRLPNLSDLDSFNIDVNAGKWKLSAKDIVELNEEEVVEKYEIEGFWTQTIVRQVVKTLKNTSNFANFIWSNLPIMLLIMMPGVAFLLKLFYVRRDYYFVEHLVFSFHIHAFFFLIVSVLMLLPKVSAVSFLSGFSIVGFLLYLYIAFKNYYGQGRFKTLMKLFGLFIGYVVLLCIAMLFTIFISALIF